LTSRLSHIIGSEVLFWKEFDYQIMGFFRKSSGAAANNNTAHAPYCSPLDEEYLNHTLEPGDHVIRWSKLLIYPIQIHGIVLSAGAGLVTIIDFGLSSTKSQHGKSQENHIAELAQENRDRRLNIITLTEQKEVDQWKKVNYGGSLLSEGKWAKILSWFQKNEKTKLLSTEDRAATDDVSLVGAEGDKQQVVDDPEESRDVMTKRLSSSCESSPVPPPDEIFAQQKEAEGLLAWLRQEQESDQDQDEEQDENKVPDATNLTDEQEQIDSTSGDDDSKCYGSPSGSEPTKGESSSKEGRVTPPSKRKTSAVPRLPKSDPPAIVLSRVRFLLSDHGRSTLPPHHMLFANSECIAVWCKTGRFSTIQSQIFLHSTALGNAKTATTVALIVGAQTVTVSSTVPVAGFWGWLGFTTTTTSQVGLLSVNPWLIPVLAGSGIAAVGTPYLILHQAQSKWEKATSELNDIFWQCATPDVYVDAIQHWSRLR
jgi:hypothetical protein